MISISLSLDAWKYVPKCIRMNNKELETYINSVIFMPFPLKRTFIFQFCVKISLPIQQGHNTKYKKKALTVAFTHPGF